jgi:DNA-binding transcriptional LysR family regulator
MSRTSALDWDDLRIALSIAESGTLSGAAAKLQLSHPTLSRRLQLIEQRLGTRLFERTPSGLRPTEAGGRSSSISASASR